MPPVSSVRVFEESDRSDWESFLRASRNGTFLHARGYLEYHQDRFPDSSLLIHGEGNLLALLPATRHGECLHSHRGLTYGGLLVGREFHGQLAVPVFEAICRWGRTQGLRKLVYKPVPHIYHRMPAEEDIHGLFCLGARLTARNLSSAIRLEDHYPRAKGRKSALKAASRHGLTVGPSTDFEGFMRIEADHLQRKHGTTPVHTAAEIRLLAGRFPDNIVLTAALRGSEMLGGVITYNTDMVCHAQYIAATDEGKELGVLDLCIDYAISGVASQIRWFDFGISTLDSGRRVDEMLLLNKESWGARSVVYDQYELEF